MAVPKSRQLMSRPVLAVIPGLLVVGVIVAGAASAIGSTDSTPPAKLKAMNAGHVPSAQEQQATLDQLQAQTAATVAPLAKLNAAKAKSLASKDSTPLFARAEELIRRDYQLIAAPGDVAGRKLDLANTGKKTALQAEINAIWVPAKVAERLSDVQDNLQLQATDPTMLTFDQVKLTVTSTGTATSDGNNAVVTFTGSFAHHVAGSGAWETEPTFIWTVELTNGGAGGWKLASIHQQSV